MEFIEPWFFEKRLSLDVNLFYRDLDYLSLDNLYSEVDAGLRVGLLKDLPKAGFPPETSPKRTSSGRHRIQSRRYRHPF